MNDGEILILKGHEISSLLNGQEKALIDIVKKAYIAHAQGDSSLPHSTFVHFPDDESNRIIALPAYLGQEFGVAGVKWVSSFPRNRDRGMDRASAVLILNSPVTGRPEAIIEGSIISAKRTAASAALAAQYFHNSDDHSPVGIIGAGLINFEIVKSLRVACPEMQTFMVFDIVNARAVQFKNKCLDTFHQVEICTETDINTVLKKCRLISFATTASKPYLSDLSACPPDTTILHISLRDLSPEVILSCDNVADDVSHVCRANTSLHLAEQLVGHRDFIRCNLADILLGLAPVRAKAGQTVVFSPFGLGVLDLAVGEHVCELARQRMMGTFIGEFFPASWIERD
ncbi:MAG: 2,3-diaminopropionate biosynthesis protein SbnB [Pyrinomonadaceae bacterium]